MALLGTVFLATGCGGGRLPHEGKGVAELECMLHDASPAVQCQGALGLSQHGTAALPALQELLRSPEAVVCQNAALAVGEIGPDARGAVPALADLLKFLSVAQAAKRHAEGR
jgi:hypothetical protein